MDKSRKQITDSMDNVELHGNRQCMRDIKTKMIETEFDLQLLQKKIEDFVDSNLEIALNEHPNSSHSTSL